MVNCNNCLDLLLLKIAFCAGSVSGWSLRAWGGTKGDKKSDPNHKNACLVLLVVDYYL